MDDPRPQRRIVATKREWEHLRAVLLTRRRCDCGCGRRAESLHHLVGRGQGGDDVRENLVALAGDGTRLCHGALTSGWRVYDMETKTYITPEQVRRGIRRDLPPDKLAYVISTKSWDFLDSAYPRLST